MLSVPNHIEAWSFELTGNPNILYQTVMRYDGTELTVTTAHKMRVDKLGMSDITNTWRQGPILVAQLVLVRETLELPKKLRNTADSTVQQTNGCN